MGLSYAQVLFFLLLTASTMAVTMARRPIKCGSNNPWHFGFNCTNCPYKNGCPPPPQHNDTKGPNKIVVGGSEHWHFGFNYADWASKNGPFYLNDTLVFKYDPPSANNTFLHSVYLLPSIRSFKKCDLRGAEKLADVTQGGGEGFEFVLNSWKPYYFACGEHNGTHCDTGMMKFFVMPMFRMFHN